MRLSIRCIRKAARMLTLAKTYFKSLGPWVISTFKVGGNVSFILDFRFMTCQTFYK
jgi:hypothetical protein